MEKVTYSREYWVDENNNKWDCDKYAKEDAIYLSNTLENCYDCTNCKNCYDCYDCYDCKNCDACVFCHNCKMCYGCTNCKNHEYY